MIFRFLASPLLAPLSLLYWAGLSFDRFQKSRRQKKLPKAVISIGNLTLGGRGKTPLLIRLCRDLKDHGLNPAVLSRGYRGPGRPSAVGVFEGPVSAERANDEIAVMSEKLPDVPLGLGPDRSVTAGRILEKSPVDIFLLDDGFQHWALHRDADLVTVDATNPWGGGHLVPWGRLREPVSALDRATAVVVTRTELLSERERLHLEARMLSKVPAEKLIFSQFKLSLRRSTGESEELLVLKNRTVLAVSGIGNPRAFEENLRQLGARVVPRRFPDHHAYIQSEVNSFIEEANNLGALVVVTEKDAVKIRTDAYRFYVLEAAVEFVGAGRDRWTHLIHDLSKLSLRA